ncbi:hypothetical protein P3T76_016352 [Phytophthora citrophthora]|uniref:Transmembrane protein n=1 Tax=Phytophthora citrophthora TaxID=4793 RepID=A0AAD9FXN9_9STRA|nr:hypothetical protein P3T76_016352 [Phytophthora citrophthora]
MQRILVSIVVSIPACHAGDPGTIPGREASFCSHLLFCSSALLLPPALLPPPTLLLFCSSALLLFCSSALLFFAALFPAVRAPQPTSLMLPTHSWRIGTSAAVESDSPTRTKIDTCTAPYSSLVEDAGERCLVARSGDEGMVERWLVYPPVTRVTRVQFPDGKLLFAPTCSSALLLFCSSALLPPPTLLLFCSSALLLFCFAFLCRSLSCRSRTTTDISHATNAQLAHRHLCCCRIGLTNADEDRHVHGAVLVVRASLRAPSRCVVIGRGCGRKVFGGAEWRRGYGRARVVVCVGGGRSWLVYPPVTRVTRVQFPDGKLLFAPTCSSALLLFCSSALLPPPTLLLFCSSALLLFCFAFLCRSLSCRSRTTTDISHATNAQLAHRHLCCCRIGLTNADEDRHVHGAVLVVRASLRAPSRCVVIGRGCGRKVFGGAEWRRGYGRARVVVCVGGGRSWLVYPPVTRVTRVQFPDGKLLFAPTCSSALLLFCSSALLLPPALLPPPTLLLFCSSALLLFCFAFLCRSLSCRSRTTTDISHATNAQLAHRHLCCCRIGLTNADEDRHVHGAVLVVRASLRAPSRCVVIGRGCGRNVFGGAEWRRGILVSIVVSIPACHAGDPGTIPGREASFCSHLLFCSSALLLFCSHLLFCPHLLFCSSALLFFAAFFPAVRAPQPTSLMLPTHSWRIGTSAAVESDSPTRTKIDTCTAPYSSLVEDAGETCLVARSGDEGMVERVWSILVSIVVSIPACHAGDPGTIPGREASFCSHLLFCSSALLLFCSHLLFCPHLLFCSSALLLFCSSALLFFAALFPAVRAPQPTSLMLPTHSWRIGTSAAVESDSPTRTKIDTCTAPYSSLVEDAGETCLVARSGDEGMVERVWSILVSIVVSIPACHAGDPGTIPGREASFCSHLLFCSSALLLPPALLLFCSSALLLFCSSALLFFAALFPAVRAPQPTSLMLPTHSWRIGTSATVESDSPTRTKIDTCTAPYSSLVEDAGETCLVARSGDEGMVERVWSILVSIVVSIPACHAGDPGTIPGREASFCSHLLFCSSALLLFCSHLLFCPHLLFCSSALLLFCSSALLFFAALFPAVRAPQPTSLMLPTHSWRIGTSAAVESDSPTRTKIDTCTAPYSSLVEDAGETCLVARSGDEGMVERVWSILVSIVVSIPACHAGDPGTIPGREASFCSHLLFCSSALLLPPALLLFCSSALLLFCSSALLFFAALFPAVRAPQPTSLMLPTHSWRIGTSATVESDSPTRTKIDTCTAPYSSLVEDAGETCLVARSGDEGMVERVWSILVSIVVSIPACHAGDPGTIPGREASFCSHLLFCSSALLLFCSSALLLFCPHLLFCSSALLLFCSSALLFFAALFPAVRAPQPTSLMLPTHSWRIGTSAAVESDSPTRTKIDTCTAPYSSILVSIVVSIPACHAGDPGTIPGREASFCSHLLFCSSALLLFCSSALLLFCPHLLFCSSALLLFCSSALLFFAALFPAVRAPQPTSLMLPTHSWRIGTSAAVESDSPTRTKIDTCTAPYSSLVEDAGETCLVARSGDEGMVERWLVYPPVTRVTRVQFPDGKLLFAPTCSSALLLFCSSALLPPPTLLLFCSSALLLFCFAFLCRSLSCRSRTTTDISHATNAQLAHRHLCCCRIGLTNADEDRHVHGAVLVIGRGCGRKVFGGAEWRRGYGRARVVVCVGGGRSWLVYPPVTRVTRVQFPDGKLLFAPTCSSALLLFCSSALLFFAALFPAVRAPQPTSLMLPTHSWRIGTSAAVESDSPTRTKIDTCTAPYSSLVEDAGETCLVARSGDEGMVERVWSILVSIVVSIPACHAGDPGTIPGREASFCSHLLFCSSALLLPPALLLFCSSALLPPPTLLLFCSSALLLFCSSALLFFAALFPAVRAPQPTSLMLPTHSWRIGTSAAVESDSPTRTKIDTCTAPYSSLVEDAGERCLVARSGDEGFSLV